MLNIFFQQHEKTLKQETGFHFASYYWISFSSSSSIGFFMSCFNILEILKCDSHSQFSNSQFLSRIVYLLCISELSGSISNNTDRQYIFSTNTNEIVVCLTHIPQFFCTPREQSSSEFFWCISSHQLLVAIKIQYQGKLILDFTTIVG